MRIGAILQARSSSTRLPDKVLLRLPYSGPTNVLQHIARRVARSARINQLVIATTLRVEDDRIANLFPGKAFRGDESNVLSRFYLAAEKFQLELLVRLTGDNPCIDVERLDQAIAIHLEKGYDYSRTTGLPLGTNFELMSIQALKRAYREARDHYELEHVTPYLYRHPELFRLGEIAQEVPENLRDLRLTMDYPSDYALLNLVFTHFGERVFSLEELSQFVAANEWLREINPNYQKREFAGEAEELEAALRLLQNAELGRAAAALQARLAQIEPPAA